MTGNYLIVALICLWPAAALAQEASHDSSAGAPTESVTVTETKVPPDQVLHDFIASYTAPSPASGKVARWHGGFCPGVVGLSESWNKSVMDRVREIATIASAPVGPQNCRPNVDIVFTNNPQALLDDVRAKKPSFLGYHDVHQERRLATVSHALQSWYMTQTVDSAGGTFIDNKLNPSGDLTFTSGSSSTVAGNSFTLPNAHVEYWSGSHLADERRSELVHVLVVIDLTKVEGIRLNSIADDVAMLSLAQTSAFDVCQPIPSISNLTAPNCDTRLKTDMISPSDQAYLHALYTIDPHDSLVQQRGKMAFEMKKSLTGH
jgi:hypothetical protein